MGGKDAFSLAARLQSFRYAITGVFILLRSQHNAWLHTAALIFVVIAGTFFKISAYEWCLLIMTIALVFVSEALNTALEILCDVASPEFHPLVAKSKDVAAGAVLLSAIASVCIGVIIFLPYVLKAI